MQHSSGSTLLNLTLNGLLDSLTRGHVVHLISNFIAVILLVQVTAIDSSKAAENESATESALEQNVFPPDRNGTWGFGLGVGPNLPAPVDAVQDELGSDIGAAMWVRYHINPTWQLALHYQRLEFKSQATSFDYFGPSILIRPWTHRKWNVYLGGGAGFARAINFPRSTDRQNTFAVMGIAGVDYFLSQKWSLGLELSASHIDLDDNRAKSAQTTTPMIALTYYPENRPEPAVQKQVAAKAVDSDKDGVLDSRDACPGTPMGTRVNRLGCALKAKIEIKITVEFDTGSDVIKPEYLDEVARVAGLLKEHPDQKVVIAGHTDSTGDLNKNIELSERRAQRIVSKLVEAHGVSANRLKAIGYGPKIPIAGNDTPEGRALNRRVIVELSGE